MFHLSHSTYLRLYAVPNKTREKATLNSCSSSERNNIKSILKKKNNLDSLNAQPRHGLTLNFSISSFVREGTFFIGWGGPGLQRGGSLVNILQIVEGQTCFICNQGRVIVFFGKEKITPCRLVDSYSLTNTRSVQKPKTCIYEQSYQSKLI